YASALKRARPAVVRHLQQLLRRPEDPRLPRLIEFAGRLEHADLREPFTALATHRDPEVRSQVARALGKYPHAESIAALRLLAQDDDFQRLMQSDALPPITILVPAHNESATIEASVTAILTLEYRSFEIIVVNDGSKDDTLERLRHAFDLYEVPRTYPETIATKALQALYRSRTRTRLLVIDKENG